MKKAAARKGQIPDGASSNVVTSGELRPVRRGSGMLSALDLQPIQVQPRFQPSSDARYHVNDLLKFHDATFIQNAYRAILKRGPDAVGYRTFLESLRSAQLNKIDILARLRYSAEGRAKQVEVEGLWLPATIRKAYRVPFIGYVLNLLVASGRLPTLIRNQQQFEAHILAQQGIIVEHLNHADRLLLAHAEEVSQVLQTQAEASKTLQQTIMTVIERSDQMRAHFERELQDLAQSFREITELFSGARRDIEVQLGELTNLVESRGNELNARLDDERTGRERSVETIARDFREAAARWQENFAAFEKRHKQWDLALRLKEVQLQQADSSQREQIALTARELKSEVARIFEKQQQVSTELVLQGERLATVLAEARKRLPAPFDEAQLRSLAREEDHVLDAFYASFDEQFRGRREEIKQRLRVYLPIIEQNGIGTEQMPVLDVGSGRGEWRELVKEKRLHARGVDSNRILVEWSRNRKLDVAEEDLISHLQQLPDASLGAVTGFHIIEHLPIETLVEFLNQAVRVLKPGGAVIFETPNPQNVLVGSCNFYFDPTHRNPLPSQVTKFLVESL